VGLFKNIVLQNSKIILANLLLERSQGNCELCNEKKATLELRVGPSLVEESYNQIHCCETCVQKINEPLADPPYWRCLSNTIWSEHSPVKVMAWRILLQLSSEDWANDMLMSMYLDDEELAWAESGIADAAEVHKDAFGQVLIAGDAVTLTKDLDVKGANFTAKRGTTVKNIRLVEGNTGQIEGKVNDQQIVILTQFVKKLS